MANEKYLNSAFIKQLNHFNVGDCTFSMFDISIKMNFLCESMERFDTGTAVEFFSCLGGKSLKLSIKIYYK